MPRTSRSAARKTPKRGKSAGDSHPKRPAETKPATALSTAQLLDFYYYLKLNRMVEERLSALYRQGKVQGGLYSSKGQEAISVGTAFALAPQDVLASAKILLPEIVADDDNARTPMLILRRSEISSEDRLQAEHSQEIRANPCSREVLHRFARTRALRDACSRRHTDALENVASIFTPLPNGFLRQIEQITVHAVFLERFVDANQPLGLGKWEWPEQCALDHREDRGVRTDSESECGYGDDAKRRRLQQHSQRVAKIVHMRAFIRLEASPLDQHVRRAALESSRRQPRRHREAQRL
jgi:hypothetical protein